MERGSTGNGMGGAEAFNRMGSAVAFNRMVPLKLSLSLLLLLSLSMTLEKHPSEARLYDFDFSAQVEIAAGDTIASVISATATRLNGGGTLTLAATGFSGPRVQVTISGGLDGDDYTVTATVLTTAGRTLVGCGRLEVRTCCGC